MSHKNCASNASLGVSKYCSAIYMSAAKFVLIFLYIWAIHYDHCGYNEQSASVMAGCLGDDSFVNTANNC